MLRNIPDFVTSMNETRYLVLINRKISAESIRTSILHIVNGVPHDIKDKVGTHSFHGFSQYVKQFLIGDYIGTCHIEGCYICKHDVEKPLE